MYVEICLCWIKAYVQICLCMLIYKYVERCACWNQVCWKKCMLKSSLLKKVYVDLEYVELIVCWKNVCWKMCRSSPCVGRTQPLPSKSSSLNTVSFRYVSSPIDPLFPARAYYVLGSEKRRRRVLLLRLCSSKPKSIL